MQLVPYAPKEVIDASIVQLITVTGATSSVEEFRTKIEAYKGVKGCTGATSGEVMGEKGKFVGVIGWESLVDSESGHGLDADVGGEVEVHHVNFRFPVKGFRGL